jgi:SOS-response transcriptional repressor LexA
MSHFGSKIRALRAERGWSQDDLAQRSHLHRNTIKKIERTAGQPEDLSEKNKYCLAGGFEISVEELVALYQPSPVQQQQGDPAGGVPIINRAPAGDPVDYEHMGLDNGVGYDYIPRIGSGVHDPTAFAFVVVGDSMSPEFQTGDTVVCSPQAVIKDGDAVFVRFTSEGDEACTFKRVYDRGEQVELSPDNRRYQPRVVMKEHIIRMSKVVAKWVVYK